MIRQQSLPFTVLKHNVYKSKIFNRFKLQQCLPFTVLKLSSLAIFASKFKLSKLQQCLPFTVLKLYFLLTSFSIARLQQCLPFTVCAEGCETSEEQRDDEGRTSQVPEQSEGKTKMMKQQYLPFTVLEHTHQVRS